MLYGFDVGGTKIAFSVYDQDLNCLLAEQEPTPSDYHSLLAFISKMVNEADQKFSCTGSIGIGLPGSVSSKDGSVNCANVNAIQGHHLAYDLSVLLKREVILENDANCFLLSECYGGSADGCATVLGITLGTGVGAAIYVNGDIHRGYNALAGEIGHYPIAATVLLTYPDLPIFSCACGRRLCLETYTSGTGLASLYKHYAKTSLKGPQIIDKYDAGDKTAANVMAIYLDILAAGLATAMLVLDPDAIVLGGGLSNFALLTQALLKRLPEHLLKGVNLPNICVASFGATGGVRGAALLNYPR